MGITVREAMNIGALRYCHVVAGHKGLERLIENITVMEVPDVILWLKGHELLVTSLYPIKDDSEAQSELVPKLVKVGASAIAIKTHRFVERVPPAIIEAGDKMNFPVIEITEDIAYIDVLTPLMKEILSRTEETENDVEAFFQWITEMAMEGKGISNLTAAIGQYTGNPVLLESDIPAIPKVLDLYEIGPMSAGDYRELKQSRRSLRIQRVVNGKTCSCVVAPVLIHGEIQGVLSCLELNRALGHADLVVLERVVPLITLEFLKIKARLEVEMKYKNDFLNDILLGNIGHSSVTTERMRHLGWDLTSSNRVIVCEVDKFSDIVVKYQQEEVLIEEFKKSLLRGIERVARLTCSGIATGMRGDQFVLIRPQFSVESESIVRSWIGDVQQRLRLQIPDMTFNIGVSRPYSGIQGIRDAFTEAIRALELGRPLQSDNDNMIFFSDLGIYKLFHPSSGPEDLEEFYRETIAPIEIYDVTHGTQLLETLQRFFERNYGLTDAAESLFVHVNTLKYRLQKVEEISGCRISEAEGRLRLQLGVKLRLYRGIDGY